MTYELFCNSVRGSSHIRKGTPCEDYGIKLDCGEFKIFAAADGHGDPNCLRSNIGSEYICRIASEELNCFAAGIKQDALEESLLDKENAKPLVKQLINSIVGKWATAVSDHLKQNPLTEEDLQTASLYAKEYRDGIRTERIYGTTLIAGLQTERYLLLLQQGDGRCDVFDCRGNVSQPIPWDDRCVGTATTSLCDNDAAQSFRYHIIDLKENPVIACIAGTDGVEDSFPTSMEKTHAFYRDLMRYACENGVQALEEHLVEVLNDLSQNGSADDVTVSGIIDVERVKPFLEAFAERNRIVDMEDEVAILVGKVKSIEDGGKFSYLEKKYNDAAAEYERAEKALQELSADCEALSATIEAFEREQPESENKPDEKLLLIIYFLAKAVHPQDTLSCFKLDYEYKCEERDAANEALRIAADKKEAAEKEYIPYKEKYDSFVRKRDEAKKKLDELKGQQS